MKRMNQIKALRLSISLAGTLLAVALTTLTVTLPWASTATAAALEVALDADGARVDGDGFRLAWAASGGGDITSIQVFDTQEWRELMGGTTVRSSFPGARFVTAEGDFSRARQERMEWVETTADRAVLEVEQIPTTTSGAASAARVTLRYTVYAEGAVFVDLQFRLPDGSQPIQLERASVGWPMDVSAFDLKRSHWRRSLGRSANFLDLKRSFRTSGCTSAGVALGRRGEFTNHVQVNLERTEALGGGATSFQMTTDNYLIFHLRPKLVGVATIPAGATYENRLGLYLGTQKRHSPLMAARLAYWQEGGASGMWLPSLGALEAMRDMGANKVVLGPDWRRDGARVGWQPIDGEAFAAFVDDAKAMGLGVGVTVDVGGDPDELGRWARDVGVEGLVIDKASPYYGTLDDPGVDLPARTYFEWTHRLRRALGEEPWLIAHPGLSGPDLSMALVCDGHAWGDLDEDRKSATQPLMAAYLGAQGYAIGCPIAELAFLKRKRAVAGYAASGQAPLVPMGTLATRSAYRAARWVLPLWNLYRTLPSGDPSLAAYGPASGIVARTNGNFGARVFSLGMDTQLLLTSNLSLAVVDSSDLALDIDALGMQGSTRSRRSGPWRLKKWTRCIWAARWMGACSLHRCRASTCAATCFRVASSGR